MFIIRALAISSCMWDLVDKVAATLLGVCKMKLLQLGIWPRGYDTSLAMLCPILELAFNMQPWILTTFLLMQTLRSCSDGSRNW